MAAWCIFMWDIVSHLKHDVISCGLSSQSIESVKYFHAVYLVRQLNHDVFSCCISSQTIKT